MEIPPIETAPAPPEGAPGKQEPGRAGRNLPAAIGVGVGLGAVVLLTLFAYKPSFVVVVVLAVVYGCYELRTAIATVEARPPLVPLVLGGAAIAGWYTAQLALVLPDSDVSSQRQRLLVLGLLVLASAGLAAVGLLVQRWCRLDDERDRDPSDPRFGSDDSRYR